MVPASRAGPPTLPGGGQPVPVALHPSPERIPSFVALIGFLGPLLGIAFGFDAINQERADQTLPRLASQPIHRDDVVNGKFAAGLATIGLTLVTLVAVTSGLGIVRMGITPSADDVGRLLGYLAVALACIGGWLAFAVLCSAWSAGRRRRP